MSWTDDREAAIAEYVGTFPGSTPHGNTKNARPRQYMRTKPDIIDTIRIYILKATPSEVVQAWSDDDVVVGGLQSKKPTQTNRANVADRIQTLQNMTQSNGCHPLYCIHRTRSTTLRVSAAQHHAPWSEENIYPRGSPRHCSHLQEHVDKMARQQPASDIPRSDLPSRQQRFPLIP